MTVKCGHNPRILEINKIKQFHHLAARIFLKSQPITMSDMCESILGLIRLPAQIDIRKYSFSGNPPSRIDS